MNLENDCCTRNLWIYLTLHTETLLISLTKLTIFLFIRMDLTLGSLIMQHQQWTFIVDRILQD